MQPTLVRSVEPSVEQRSWYTLTSSMTRLLVVVATLWSCSSPVTQTVVCLYLGPESAERATALRVRVLDNGGGVVLEREVPNAEFSELRGIPLVPQDNEASRRFQVVAELLDDTGTFSRVELRGGFEDGSLLSIPLRFRDACIDVACPEGSGCTVVDGAGRCDSTRVDPAVVDRRSLAAACPDMPDACDACSECQTCEAGACVDVPFGTRCGPCAGDRCEAGACVSSVRVDAVGAGRASTCARIIRESGEREVLCMGQNDAGQLGIEPGDDVLVPTASQIPLFNAIDLGDRHGCAVDESNRLLCWGSDDAGQLGRDGDVAPAPVEPGIGDVLRVATGDDFTCVSSDDELSCWGSDRLGQLGLDCSGSRDTPMTVRSGVGIENLSAGASHACAAFSGIVRCWGSNSLRQITSDPADDVICAPTQSTGRASIPGLAAGEGHTCYFGMNGEVACRGSNRDGQCAQPFEDIVGYESLELTDTIDALEVAAGASHSAVLLVTGELYTFGSNARGQLAATVDERTFVPQRVPGNWQNVVVDRDHTCAIDAQRRLYCWGANERGQLGTGDTGDRSAPSRVCFDDV